MLLAVRQHGLLPVLINQIDRIVDIPSLVHVKLFPEIIIHSAVVGYPIILGVLYLDEYLFFA